MEWEMHGGGKLQVKDLQSHDSKVVFALYYVYTGTPFHLIKKTLKAILREATDMLLLQEMAPDEEYNQPNLLQISIHPQVPRLKGANTSSYDKPPYHIRENRKALHIESKPADKKELKELFQYAKEHNLESLCLGKQAYISEVMDNESTPGEIKRMVKYDMGHANYQGSITGEMIVGIALLDGGVSPMIDGGMVSLQMVLFNYFKLEEKFSVFAELHQPPKMGPVLAIILACKEAKCLIHMMNKQVTAFLFYFLRNAALPEKFLRSLLKETCDATLVTEIDDCVWDKDTQTITGPTQKNRTAISRNSRLQPGTRMPST
jgi:hypothetical protein